VQREAGSCCLERPKRCGRARFRARRRGVSVAWVAERVSSRAKGGLEARPECPLCAQRDPHDARGAFAWPAATPPSGTKGVGCSSRRDRPAGTPGSAPPLDEALVVREGRSLRPRRGSLDRPEITVRRHGAHSTRARRGLPSPAEDAPLAPSRDAPRVPLLSSSACEGALFAALPRPRAAPGGPSDAARRRTSLAAIDPRSGELDRRCGGGAAPRSTRSVPIEHVAMSSGFDAGLVVPCARLRSRRCLDGAPRRE
jgi:hypothetical protein